MNMANGNWMLGVKRSPSDMEAAIDLYEQGYSALNIERMTGIAASTFIYHAHALGVNIRPPVTATFEEVRAQSIARGREEMTRRIVARGDAGFDRALAAHTATLRGYEAAIGIPMSVLP